MKRWKKIGLKFVYFWAVLAVLIAIVNAAFSALVWVLELGFGRYAPHVLVTGAALGFVALSLWACIAETKEEEVE